ncbi:hypothetical protein M0657_008978 [Pyricularia oryzae]|uniref:Uncharacterized protein n=2 Tax=Pyricularia oryzae TaxID=318829 RepID=A0AA97PFF8_PYRO3|nr:hypothetical protein OOU_Y34scaffold01081g11 [Pyricularia oryzae Y34]KAI7915633.1 hypothetical protein M0657_008978 [Pyricularia oryzae]KAI7916701.1 hypothetical protein M9X92_007750 [Pyricularia oryzae]
MATLERSQVFLVEQSGMTVQQAVDGKTVTDGTMHKYKNTDMMEQRLAQNNDKNKTQALPLSCCPVPGTAGDWGQDIEPMARVQLQPEPR